MKASLETLAFVLVSLGVVLGNAMRVDAGILYIGSTNEMIAFNTGAGTIANSFSINPNSGPMAVADTIRMRVAALGGDRSTEYSLGGTLLGSTTVGTPYTFRGWDGATDGVNFNYAIPNKSLTTTVFRYDRNWDNETALFTFSNDPFRFGLGVTYDTSNNTLWVDVHLPGVGNEIRNYDLTGDLLRSFSLTTNAGEPVGRPGPLAYDGDTDTLWFLTELVASGDEQTNTLIQFDKSGTRLGSFVLSGTEHRYNMEFAAQPPGAPIPEPSTLAILSVIVIIVTFVRRRDVAALLCAQSAHRGLA